MVDQANGANQRMEMTIQSPRTPDDEIHQNVEIDHSLRSLCPTDDNRIINLLTDHHAALPTRPQGIHHDIVTEHIELLLVLALNVGGASQADEVDKSGFTDVRGDVFGCDLGWERGV